MPTFNDLNSLFSYVKSQMKDVMENEVAETVRDYEQEAIDREVYDKYNIVNGQRKEPYMHERRRDDGGLRDRRNMKLQVDDLKNGVSISIKNVTRGAQQNFEIADLVEFGDGYGGKKYEYPQNRDRTGYQYRQARPFTKATIEDLKRDEAHIKSFKEGLRKRGIKTT